MFISRGVRRMLAVGVIGAIAAAAQAQPVGTAFTYQGRLAENGNAANGVYDFLFTLFDAQTDGAQVGSTLCVNNVPVGAGAFAVSLDFGSQFAGERRFLEVLVRADAGLGCSNSSGYVTLTPRQAITASPYAIHALSAAMLDGQPASYYTDASHLIGVLPSTLLAGTYSGALSLANPGNEFAGFGAALTGLDASHIASGTISNARTTANTSNLANTLVLRGFAGNFNAGTITATAFQGSGSGLTSLNATQLTSGTINNARTTGASTNTPNTLVLRDGAGAISATSLAGSGSALTDLDASHLTLGTVGEARLSSNIPRLNAANNFTEVLTVNAGVTLTPDGRLGIGVEAPAKRIHLAERGSPGTSVTNPQQLVSNWILPTSNWQSFTAGVSGRLSAIRIQLVTTSHSGTITVRAGTGTGGAVLCVCPSDGVFIQDGWFEFTIPVGKRPYLTAGSVYTFVPDVAAVSLFGSSVNSYAGGRAGSSPNDDLAFQVLVAPDGVEPFDILVADGTADSPRIGVGTSSPNTPLDIRSTGYGLQHTDGTRTFATYMSSFAQAVELGSRSNHPVGFFTNDGAPNVWISTNGYLGIGTSSPSTQFACVGNGGVTGSFSKGSGTFKIDHPLDPENKYLYHSFVESPDMMNVYNGNLMTDANGFATVTLPDYFEALNSDFRYQVTIIDEAAPDVSFVRVAAKVGAAGHNRFRIKSMPGNLEISWQVTGIRKDAFANKNRVVPEVDKPNTERGKYLHPEAFDLPPEKGIHFTPARAPEAK